jgi:SAM-dependent methyltransferase
MLINGVWVKEQTNRALLHSAAVDDAVETTSVAGLPLHPDRNKNWDNYLALSHTLRVAGLQEPVLDAGAGDESAYLPALQKWGYTEILGCNLNRSDDYTAGRKNGIRYVYADITDTLFLSGSFAFVACLSVIEHGVDWRKFLIEMHRILRLNGELFVSFDYWHEKVNTDGLITHDAPVNIFSASEVLDILDFARTLGFKLQGKIWRPRCAERIISWAGRGYTFGNLLLRKDT